MKKEYELLETYSNKKGTWSYLRHKKTGLEIAYHKSKKGEDRNGQETKYNPVTGFSFCFKTPVEDPYLGTTHVLEHCVLCGSEKYKVHFFDLLDYSCFIEEECFKLIPIMADYVFFPELLEETFLQECMRVNLSADGDGRKNEIKGVIYNEMKNDPKGFFAGGLDYKLHELTVEKIRDYHKKYYRPDNCLFTFCGMESLEKVLSLVDKFIPNLEEGFSDCKVAARKNLTIKEFLEKVPFKEAPKKLKNPDDALWFNEESKKEDICDHLESYWIAEDSPLMPYCLDEKYAYTEACWHKKNHKEKKEPPLPPRKPAQKIIKEYFSEIDIDEYKKKLESLNKWQARDNRQAAQKIMEPLVVNKDEIEFTKSEEEILKELTERCERNKRYKRKPKVLIQIDKHSCIINFEFTEEKGRDYYADFLLLLFLKRYFSIQLREEGELYDINVSYGYFFNYNIFSNFTNKPKKTMDFIKEHIKKIASYKFTEADMLIIKSLLYTRIFMPNNQMPDMSNEVFNVTPEDLHQAALRYKKLVVKYEKEEAARIAREEEIKRLRKEARRGK